MKRVQAFIRKLQRADDIRKRRWYIGSAAVLTAIVLFTWGWYVAAFVIPRAAETAPRNASSTATGTGFLETMRNGWNAVGTGFTEQFKNPENSFGGAIGGIAEKANETRDILIETPESNFYFAGEDERATATLPIAPKKNR